MCKKKSILFLLGFFIIAVCLLLPQQLFAQAQQAAVPVEQEPRHRIVFQNQHVRIYDVLIPPGDQTLFHTHIFDLVAISISGETGRFEMLGKPPMEGPIRSGSASFSNAAKAPYTHRLENVGTTPLRMVGIELLSSSSSPGVPAVLNTVPGHQLVLENDRVTVYRVSIDPKQSTGIRARTLPWLRVSITQSTISVQGPGKSAETIETKAGDYRWHEGATTDSIENIGSTKYEAIEIEWK
jgi:quercetin dioxygenase-like cupin family protein